MIWVVYAGYLHARATRGWTGTRAAWLSIVGYACVIINFTLVNTVFNGLHSYSGSKPRHCRVRRLSRGFVPLRS